YAHASVRRALGVPCGTAGDAQVLQGNNRTALLARQGSVQIKEIASGIVGDIDVGPAVAIQIGDKNAKTFAEILIRVFDVQARLLRDLHEAAAALAVRLVVKKRQPAPAGHQQIRPTVSVIIRDGTAVGVKAGTVEAGFARDIAKAPVPKILE